MPVVLQGESNECGLSCVAMVMAFHGHHTSLRDLRSGVGHSRQLTLNEINRLLNSHGLITRNLRCEPADLADLVLPAILHVDMNHYVILERVRRRGVTLIDPGQGKIDITWKNLSRRFTGIVVELRPGSDFQSSGKASTYSIWPLVRQLPTRELRFGLAGILAVSLLIQAFALATPFYLQVMIDEVLMVNNLEMTTVVVSGFLLIYAVSAATQLLRGLLVLMLGTRLSFMLSAGMMSHLMNISLSFFRSRTVGDIASRLSSLQPVQQFLSESIVRIFIDLLMVMTTALVLFFISFQIALAVLAATIVYLLLQYALLLPYRRHQHEYLVSDAKLQTLFIDTLQSVETIRRYEARDQQLGEWLGRLTESLNASLLASRWGLVSEIARYLLVGSLSILVVAVAAKDVAGGVISLGMLYTLTAYASHLTQALVNLTGEWQNYLMLALHAQRLSDLTDAEKETRVPVGTVGAARKVHKIECRGVSYETATQQEILPTTSFCLSNRESLAIVGPSGSGKSTLLSLIRGDAMPSCGEIRFNGHPLPGNQDPSGLFSSLLPTDRLLRGSVIDNLTFLDTRPDHKRMIKAATLAGIHDHIMTLPLAYQERLCEEDNPMSSGQRQRLLLARALYRRARILLFDEATSHLDETSEIDIMSRVLSLPRMCIFVTHRESVAQLATRVIRLDAV